MQAEILSVGSELTLGVTVDTNSAWISRHLSALGIPVRRHVTVPDARAQIAAAITEAAARCDLLVVSGGLGPTGDDLTRAALADAMGVPLIRDPAALRAIEAFFQRIGRPMAEKNLVQADVPMGAAMLENTCGTAPGLSARIGRCRVLVVPGVPREMQEMLRLAVLPTLDAGGRVIRQRVLYCFGTGESNIGAAIDDLMVEGRNPAVGTTAKDAVVGVRITADAAGGPRAGAMLDADEAEIRRRLGPVVFALDDDDLGAAVGRLLIERRLTLAVAESCTSGMIAAMLGGVPGISAVLLEGVVTYSNAAKIQRLGVPEAMIEMHGAVSEPVAAAMALGCRQHSGADWAVSATGIAGPTGGSAEKPVGLVYIGLAAGEDVTVHRHLFPGPRNVVRDRAAKTALNHLRLAMLGVSS